MIDDARCMMTPVRKKFRPPDTLLNISNISQLTEHNLKEKELRGI